MNGAKVYYIIFIIYKHPKINENDLIEFCKMYNEYLQFMSPDKHPYGKGLTAMIFLHYRVAAKMAQEIGEPTNWSILICKCSTGGSFCKCSVELIF